MSFSYVFGRGKSKPKKRCPHCKRSYSEPFPRWLGRPGKFCPYCKKPVKG